MGTAVFHPQDCLTAPQRDRNGRFSCASECPPSVARPCRRAYSATPEALAPFTDCGRNVIPGFMRPGECRKQILDQGQFLGRKNAAAGLLPAPGQVTQSAHASTFHRCPRVPMLDNSTRACFPWNGIHVHTRRQGARQSVNSPRGECRAGSWYCTAAASQKLNFSRNSHFSDVFKHGCPRWTGIGDQKVEYRKKMQPRGETYLGRKLLRPPLKVFPAAQTESICTNTTILGRKRGVGKQLKRSASEKRQEMRESSFLQRPGSDEASKKLTANSSEGVFRSCNGRDTLDVNPTLSASTAGEKRAKDLQVYWGANPHGRMGTVETGIARSSQETVYRQIGSTERNVVASLQTKCYGSVNIAMQSKDKIKGDTIKGVAGYVSQGQYHACLGDVEKSSCYSQLDPTSKLRRREPMAGSKLISRSLNSVMHNDGMWVSLMHDEKWAGPSFFNSPSPSSLPLPSFTVKFSKSASTGSKEAAKNAAYVTQITLNDSFLEESRSQDVAVATNDLRRMLNLNHASGDM